MESAYSFALFAYPVINKVQEGYISGATVFLNSNGNGQLDPSEESSVTDANGGFVLPSASTTRIAFGGTDTSIGLPFKGQLSAPPGYSIITPLTTLLNSPQLQGDAASGQKVLAALGLSSALNLRTSILSPRRRPVTQQGQPPRSLAPKCMTPSP